MIMRYNHDLNALVANGRHFFSASEDEFGSIEKIWNCVALCVMSQIHVNDSLIRTLRNDVIGPLNAAFKEDFRYSELLINSQELQEMLRHLDDAEGAYNWNVKAPAILLNFENYKRYEKELLFNAFISYLNIVNTKNAGLLSKNENAVNFILKEFNVDKEMETYSNYVVNKKIEAPIVPPPIPTVNNKPPLKNKSASSVVSSLLATAGGQDKRKSKLMLKVGSILGRKKKGKLHSRSDTIPESHSAISTTLSRPEASACEAETKNSLHQPLPPAGKGIRRNSAISSFCATNSAAAAAGAASASVPGSQKQTTDESTEVPNSKLLPSINMQSLDKAPAENRIVKEPKSELCVMDEAVPNVERYALTDDESDGSPNRNGNLMPLLSSLGLGITPKLNSEADSPVRASSAGKYSFEYGDENDSISTPMQAHKLASSALEVAAPDCQPPVYDEILESLSDTKVATRAPPPPPPSRKPHTPATDPKKEVRDFRNISISHGDAMSLRSLMTGSTLLKHDYFKHFGAIENFSRTGLNTSVAEIINVTILRGIVTKSQVLGEVAFNYNAADALERLAVKVPSKFTRFLLNDLLMQETHPGVYSLNVPLILGKTLGGIKYLLDVPAQQVPLFVKQIWKTEPTQSSLIVKVVLNPAYASEVQLDNLVVSAALDSTVTSTSASSKPEGSFNKEANRITWRYSLPLILSASNPEEKLIARIMTNGEAREAASGVRVKFAVQLPATSFVQILDLDDNAVSSVINLSSGNYTSHFQ